MRQRIDEVPRYLAIPASFRFTFQVSGTVEARVLRPSPPFLGEKGSNPTRKERTFGPSQFASRLPHDTGPTQAHFAKAPALQNRPIHSDPSHMPPQQLVAGSDVSSVHDALVDTTSSIDSPLSRFAFVPRQVPSSSTATSLSGGDNDTSVVETTATRRDTNKLHSTSTHTRATCAWVFSPSPAQS